MVAGSVIVSLGLAPVYVLTTELTVAAAPPERSGTASGMLETAANLGGALGIAFLGSIGGAVYREAMPPGTAQTLGEAARSGLADVARQAFTAGFHSAELAGAALLLARPLPARCCCATTPAPALRPPRIRARRARPRL